MPGDLTVGDDLTVSGDALFKGIPHYNVIAYGADPTGVAESSTAIQGAVDAAEANPEGGIVFIPQGRYMLNATITLAGNGISIIGAGAPPFQQPIQTGATYANLNGSVLFPSTSFTSGNYMILVPDNAPDGYSGLECRNLMFYGKDSAGTARANAIKAIAAFHFTIENCDVHYSQGVAINLDASGPSADANNVINCNLMNTTGTGIQNWAYESKVIGCELINCNWGIDVNRNVMVLGCIVDGPTQYAYVLRDDSSLVGCQTYADVGYNDVFISGNRCVVVGNKFTNAGANAGGNNEAGSSININSGTEHVIEGNHVLAGTNTRYFVYQSAAAAGTSKAIVKNNYFSGTPVTGLVFENTAGFTERFGNIGLGDSLIVGTTGTLTWGGDTNLYRQSANLLQTDDALSVAVSSSDALIVQTAGGTRALTVDTSGGYTHFGSSSGSLRAHTSGFFEGVEISDADAPAANAGRLYFKDNGAGKTQLVVRFNTGAVQVIATEP